MERMGEIAHSWGLKRIHGRIWLHLYVSPTPLDAADLVGRLSISKALVSVSIREMLDLKLALDAGRSPRGTHLFRVNPNALGAVQAIVAQRERVLMAQARTAAERALESSDETGEATSGTLEKQRLGRLIDLLSASESYLAGVSSLQMSEAWEMLSVLTKHRTHEKHEAPTNEPTRDQSLTSGASGASVPRMPESNA